MKIFTIAAETRIVFDVQGESEKEARALAMKKLGLLNPAYGNVICSDLEGARVYYIKGSKFTVMEVK